MSGRDWALVFTFAACLALAAIGLSDSFSTNINENYQTNETQENPCANVNPDDQSDCIDNEDLVAQRRMATASEDVVSLTRSQLKATTISTIINVLVAMATIGAAIAAVVAAKAAQESAETIPKLERAYLFEVVRTGERQFINVFDEIRKNPTETKYLRIHYYVKNHGKTPAIIKEYGTGADSCPNSATTNYDLLVEDNPLVIEPGDAKTQFFAASHDPIDIENVAAFESGEKHINFYGKIVYDDFFGNEHITSFYWRFKANEGFAAFRHPDGDKNYRT